MLWERFEGWARETPAAEAVVDGEVRLSYGELATRAAAFGQWLCERYGLGEGSVIAAALQNGWEYPVCFAAANRIGAVFLPVNPQWRPLELAWLAEKLGVQAALVNPATALEWKGVLPEDKVVQIEEGEAAQALRGNAARGDSAPPKSARRALLLATSGSTGQPKIVPRTNANLLAGASSVGEELGVRAGDRVLAAVPFHHANGFSNCLLMPLLSGGTCVAVRRALPGVVADCARKERVRLINVSPILYNLLADQELAPEWMESVEICISTGAHLPAALGRVWRQRFGVPIRQLYGSSETGTICIQSQDGEAQPGEVGPPLKPVSLRILSPQGVPLAEGASGEVAVRGPALMSGYVDEPSLNAACFVDGHFRTGDSGRILPGGSLALDGRLTRWINLGGVKVDPVEVENALYELPEVAWCRVMESENGQGWKVLSALIQPRAAAAVTRKQVVEHCRGRLAEYKIPRVIEFVAAMPGDAAGKQPKEWRIP